MRPVLIVDGYNVLNAWPEFVELKDNLEHARDKLADILISYGAYIDYRVVLVFDAHQVRDQETKIEYYDGMEIVFTKEGETADSYIERLSYNLTHAPEQVYVVTSDWAEQMVVLGTGACRISAREFRNNVLAAEKAMREDDRTAAGTDRHELGSRLRPDIAALLDRLRRTP